MSHERYRILYIQKPGGGGTLTALYELVRSLNRDYYEPIVLFYESDTYIPKFEALGVKVLILDHHQPSLADVVLQQHTTAHLARYGKWVPIAYRMIRAVGLVVQVARLIHREKIDLVHHNDNLYQDRFTVAAAKLAGVPQVCHMHSFSPLATFEKALIPSVNAFLHVSTAVQKHYHELGVPSERSYIVYNGFDVDSFTNICTSQTVAIRAEFGVSDQDILIVNVGRLDSWKGQDYFIQAIAQIIPHCPQVKALIVGDVTDNTPWNNEYRQKLHQLVADLHLANHIIFAGFRNDIPEILAASNMMVHSSSLPEPFGRVIVEGMLAKRSVIATAAGGALDIIENQVTGMLVPPQNSWEMAEAIRWLITHPEQAAHMCEIAQQKAKEKFSIEEHTLFVQKIYQQFLQSDL